MAKKAVVGRASRPAPRGYSSSPSRTLEVEDRLLTRVEAADILGVNERWVKRALEHHYFPRVKVGKLVRIRKSDLLAYIEAQREVGR
jgi:excisionase family DNA binding protein